MTLRISLTVCFGVVFLSLSPALMFSSSGDARCPNGYHKSPSGGDCEKVTQSGGLPRCPDGFHRSPDGDCERVSSDSSESKSSESDDNNDRRTEDDNHESQITDETSLSNSQTSLSLSTECKGSADCVRGKVTEVVDGDTLDVNNLPVRLAMVNTPEVGEGGYDEAKEFTESECSVGSEALVDEDDGQKAGSYGRLIGIVHCNGNSSSLNELLLETDNAVLYEDFCDVSEFASDDWVTKYGCDG
jgi:endonuclease YncB( thermonuclease family)